MTGLRSAADDILDEAMRLDPCMAVMDAGADTVAGLTDYSPEGHAAREEAARRALDRLTSIAPSGEAPSASEDVADVLLRDHLIERLNSRLAMLAAGEPQRELNAAMTGPLQMLAQTVAAAAPAADATAEQAAHAWSQALLRLRALPQAIDGYVASLRDAAIRGHVAAPRQIEACARRCAGWAAGAGSLVTTYGDGPLTAQMRSAAYAAGAAYARLETFLTSELAPQAGGPDAFGAERYQLSVRHFLGADMDLTELYAWGWDEFHRIEAELRREAQRLRPGISLSDVVAELDSGDASRRDEASFGAWLQELLDRTIVALDGVHFTIPSQLRRLESRIIPDATISYAAPSQDLSRPGRVSWSLSGPGPYPVWWAYSTAYHEGVPGHHLQLGRAAVRGDLRSRKLEIFGGLSASTEGWALYAESLMDELGFLTEPGARLGYLASQLLRAGRIVLDIGLHLRLRLPSGSGLADGEPWTPELGSRMLIERCLQETDNELLRYLGRPGQALAYKTGERVYLRARTRAKNALGDRFDLLAFHDAVLDVPPAGLGHLESALERATMPA